METAIKNRLLMAVEAFTEVEAIAEMEQALELSIPVRKLRAKIKLEEITSATEIVSQCITEIQEATADFTEWVMKLPNAENADAADAEYQAFYVQHRIMEQARNAKILLRGLRKKRAAVQAVIDELEPGQDFGDAGAQAGGLNPPAPAPVHLPTLQLHEFDGKQSNWAEFQ